MFPYLINGTLVLYFSLVLWKIYTNFDKFWSQHSSSFLLDTFCHLILILFLSVTFHLLKDEYQHLRINLSTALTALTACLVSLIFGISLGRSWGYAEAKSFEKHNHNLQNSSERKRVLKSKKNTPLSEVESIISQNFTSTQPSPPTTTLDTQEIYEAAEVAKSNLLSLLEINQKISSNEPPRNWKLGRSISNSHVWISTHKASNTIIKGTCLSSLSPAAVAKYLYNNNLPTGLEGIMKERETLFSFRRNRVVVSRMLCNLGKLTSAKREFYIVTYWAEMENGTIVICSRSLPDSYTPHTSTTSSKHKSYTRGFISCCGFVIVPYHLVVADSKKRGCQVSTCVDIDFASSSMGMKRQHSAKADAIINCTCELLEHISSMIPESNTHIDSLSLSPGTLLDHAMENMDKPSEKHFQGVIQGISHQHRLELKNISRDSINRLLNLHMSAVSLTAPTPTKPPSVERDSERKWTTFYDQDGIVISEYSGNDSPVGTLMASCHVNASPQMIKKLLVEFPEYVDTLLEKRNILCQLDELTTIQWIAYGAIWPVGATDFLVITTECAFNSNNPGCTNPHEIHDSFLIVSTSVDSIVEDEEEKHEENDSNDTKYNRSTLRLAGYSGTPNSAIGGTDLRLFVDVDATRYVPAWLLQILAQYGLSEMMNRIRIAAPTLAKNYMGDDRSPIFQPSSSKLGAILTQIQSREEKMRHYVDPTLIDVPKQSTRERKNSFTSSDSDAMKLNNLISNTSSSTISSSTECHSHANKDIEKGIQLAYDSQYILKLYVGILKDEKYAFDWQIKTKKNNIEVSVSPINGSAWFALKATTTIPHATKYQLRDFLINDNNLSGYDDMMDKIEPLLRINENTAIRRVMFKAIWPTAPRDFLVCTTWNELDDGTILISSRSAWNELYPPENGYVRGFLNISGYHITPCHGHGQGDEQGCSITMCAHSDLGGTLPIGIINMLAFSAPIKMLAAITALTQ